MRLCSYIELFFFLSFRLFALSGCRSGWRGEEGIDIERLHKQVTSNLILLGFLVLYFVTVGEYFLQWQSQITFSANIKQWRSATQLSNWVTATCQPIDLKENGKQLDGLGVSFFAPVGQYISSHKSSYTHFTNYKNSIECLENSSFLIYCYNFTILF